MEIKQYLYIIQRWAWLLIVGLVLGCVGGYFSSAYQTPVYQASTKLLFNRPANNTVADTSYLSDQQLAQTYMQLLTTQPVLDAASKELGYPVDATQIASTVMRDTNIIRVTVEDSDPNKAANIANIMIKVLIDYNERLQSSRFASSEDSLKEQLKQVEGQIASQQAEIAQVSEESYNTQKTQIEDQIKKLEDDILKVQQEMNVIQPPQSQTATGLQALKPTLTPDQMSLLQEKQLRLDQLQSSLQFYQQIYLNLVGTGKSVGAGTTAGMDNSRLDQMNNTLALYQQIYSNLLSSYEEVRLARMRNTPNVVQVEAAIPETTPIRPRPINTAAMGGMVGVMLAAGIILLIEYLDDTLKSPEEVMEKFNLPVVGFVAEMDLEKGNRDVVYVAEEPRSPIAEAFRSLRTNIEHSGSDKPLKTLLITSANPSEGKTTMAVNTAMALAQSGKRILFVDADLRRPHVHKFFGLSNRSGLSEILINQRSIESVSRKPKDDNLTVITSGSLPPNPSELLTSEKMTEFLKTVSEQFDMVVLDSPPFLVSDASVLASRVDGVLLVLQPGKTHAEAVKVMVDQMNRVGSHILGVIFNRIPRSRSYYYGGYRHYKNYYYRSHSSYDDYYYSDDGMRHHSNNGKSKKAETTSATGPRIGPSNN